MNWRHVKTIAWLRWRLSMNGFRRAGTLSAVIGMIFVVAALITGACSFFVGLAIGLIALPEANADHVMLIWDGIVVGFLFCWLIGLATELQQSEVLSIEKLLHLPVSVSSAFLLNYLSSWVSLTMAVFLPAMVGLSIASVAVYGAPSLLVPILVISFIWLVTAVTYQFRGWLAAMMENKRRRRAIVTGLTISIIVITQLPNLINLAVFRGMRNTGPSVHDQKVTELSKQFGMGEIDKDAHNRRLQVLLTEEKDRRLQRQADGFNAVVRYTRLSNVVLPIGWLPYGAHTATNGSVWPGLLCVIGMVGLGSASLWRSYRSALRLYTGAASEQRVNARAVKPAEVVAAPPAVFIERQLPFVSERVSAIAFTTFRSLTRAPEFKMAFMFPIFMIFMFGAMFLMGPVRDTPEIARPFIALGAMVATMFGMLQLMMNMFGFDRDAFRALVLMPVARRDILLGKNLALAPVALALCGVLLCIVRFGVQLPTSHVLATALQFMSFFVLCSLLGNTTSIVAPVALAGGTMKAAKFAFVPMLIHMVAALLFPVLIVPAGLALGAETLLLYLYEFDQVPIYLIVSVLEAVAVAFVYRPLLASQGRWLQRRETRILEVVTQYTQ